MLSPPTPQHIDTDERFRFVAPYLLVVSADGQTAYVYNIPDSQAAVIEFPIGTPALRPMINCEKVASPSALNRMLISVPLDRRRARLPSRHRGAVVRAHLQPVQPIHLLDPYSRLVDGILALNSQFSTLDAC